eukprot:CAMPEP_0203816656 /NCGR_PEP_ID=MMETSP0115-20131106/17290_1 /ASSEMBLY_ACC=CAM_ASM_000227 /TAXON_ID=33651 /ORGANISM="Bicosoecid sp, Strain ms1" /LENGTH=193 /DNA_ID=CAMNT_0050725563 /DNA_START=30 /DNA_END=609 /DNA_ORIENTATION=-
MARTPLVFLAAFAAMALIASAAAEPQLARRLQTPPPSANCSAPKAFFTCDQSCQAKYSGGDFTLRYACDDGCDIRCNDNDDDDDKDNDDNGVKVGHHHVPYCVTEALCVARCQKEEGNAAHTAASSSAAASAADRAPEQSTASCLSMLLRPRSVRHGDAAGSARFQDEMKGARARAALLLGAMHGATARRAAP